LIHLTSMVLASGTCGHLAAQLVDIWPLSSWTS